ncbi:MAG: UDP-N-acetylmuramoyl-tripeptide--D-alanyl-D-alanine ligase [Acetobacteraceae bacterium]
MSALWTEAALAAATGGRFTRGFAAGDVAIDTRGIAPGALFVALRGEHRDGHLFVSDAIARGAAGALTTHPVGEAPCLIVPDTLAGLTALGAAGRARFTGQLAAITGSVGKTTTKEMLRRILHAQGPTPGATHAAMASHNNHWGVPLTLARLPPEAAFCMAELGMNHAGEIAPLARLARPHVAVITAIAPAHIGLLGSLAAIAAEKASIFQGLEPGGTAVLPAEVPHAALLREAAGGARILSFGATADAAFRLEGYRAEPGGAAVSARCEGVRIEFRLAAPGRHMADNALAALAAAAALGVPPEAAAAALDGFAPLAGRGARRSLALPDGPALLLDESYNANPASMRAALAVLAGESGRRIAVLGDMLELGAHAPDAHAALAADLVADHIFLCGAEMRHLRNALPGFPPVVYAPDAAALAPLVAAELRAGDTVLVKGSLGSRMQSVIAALAARAEGG